LRWRPLKIFDVKYHENQKIRIFLNGRHLETGLVRVITLIPFAIHTKILCQLLSFYKIKIKRKLQKELIVKYTYIQTDRQKTRNFRPMFL
jgi:hypothetical protein